MNSPGGHCGGVNVHQYQVTPVHDLCSPQLAAWCESTPWRWRYDKCPPFVVLWPISGFLVLFIELESNTLLRFCCGLVCEQPDHGPWTICKQSATRSHSAHHICLFTYWHKYTDTNAKEYSYTRCRYLSAACWPGAEPLRFRDSLQGPGKVVFFLSCLFALEGVSGGGLVKDIEKRVQPQNLCHFSVGECSYGSVNPNRVPCQCINCLPSSNPSGITPSVLLQELNQLKTILNIW